MGFDDEWLDIRPCVNKQMNVFVNNQPGLKQREQNGFGFS